MKIFSFFSKFKFKWWSWEIDAIKILNYFIIILAFLPILPYEKKDGKLISVMGFEARENNFYIRLSDFSLIDTNSEERLKYEAKKTNKVQENNLSILYEIGKYLEKNGIVNNEKYKNYLDSKNYSEELKTCLIFRNMIKVMRMYERLHGAFFCDFLNNPKNP